VHLRLSRLLEEEEEEEEDMSLSALKMKTQTLVSTFCFRPVQHPTA